MCPCRTFFSCTESSRHLLERESHFDEATVAQGISPALCLRHKKLAKDAQAPSMNTASSMPTLAFSRSNSAWRIPCSSEEYQYRA